MPWELRAVRTYLKLSQAQFAKRLGVYRQTLTRWETPQPRADTDAREHRVISKQQAYAILNAALLIAHEQGRPIEPIQELFAVVDSRH